MLFCTCPRNVIDTLYQKICAKFSPDYLDSPTNFEYVIKASETGMFPTSFVHVKYTVFYKICMKFPLVLIFEPIRIKIKYLVFIYMKI